MFLNSLSSSIVSGHFAPRQVLNTHPKHGKLCSKCTSLLQKFWKNFWLKAKFRVKEVSPCNINRNKLKKCHDPSYFLEWRIYWFWRQDLVPHMKNVNNFCFSRACYEVSCHLHVRVVPSNNNKHCSEWHSIKDKVIWTLGQFHLNQRLVICWRVVYKVMGRLSWTLTFRLTPTSIHLLMG